MFAAYIRGCQAAKEPVHIVKKLTEAEWVDAMITTAQLLHPLPAEGVAYLAWEYSGWAPACWESSSLLLWKPSKADGFHRWIPRFLDEYPAQTGWLYLYRLWIIGLWRNQL